MTKHGGRHQLHHHINNARSVWNLAKGAFKNAKSVHSKFKHRPKHNQHHGRQEHSGDIGCLQLKGQRLGTSSWKSTIKFGKYHNRPPFAININTPFYKWNNQYVESITATVGRQAIGGLSSLYTPSDIQSICGTFTSVSTGAAHDVYYKNASLTTIATNAGFGAARVVIYNVLARNDISTTTTVSPLADWGNGMVDITGGVNPSTTWGETPFDSGRFGHNWKIYKITTHLLAPGESFIHKLYVNPNRRFNQQALADITNNAAAGNAVGSVKHLTHFQFMVLQPFPGHDSTVNTNITTGVGKLDVCYVTRYCSYVTQANARTLMNSSTFNATYTTKQVGEATDSGVLMTPLDP